MSYTRAAGRIKTQGYSKVLSLGGYISGTVASQLDTLNYANEIYFNVDIDML